ncbi:MAG TPA: aminotransferase class V-fold PLP-dependent enzyme, partial [Geminicoccaceae bacterium]|nr:aminotransferase class V-fold PLP-dependent enzyme [Geminicoccaceae bacterium]
MLPRRDFLARAGAIAAAGTAASSTAPVGRAAEERPDLAGDWGAVRDQFALSPDHIHMSALLISSHPKPVRDAIEEHRRGLDADPVAYLQENNSRLKEEALAAAGGYLGVAGSDVALTESTTMGIGLVYNGLRLGPGQEILTTEQDYYVTHEAVRLAAERSGASARRISLYERIDGVSADGMVARIRDGIGAATRVLALTWVHSSTGLKLPLRQIADALDQINAGRDEPDRVLFCVDGVHGFGNQDVELSDLGCDLFAAGCHKWLFGPRGTGILAGTARGWAALLPTIPSFLDDGTWHAWLTDSDPEGPTTASAMTPGGFKAFEHRWALAPAFAFHQEIGKGRVAARTHELAGQLKEGLATMPPVTLHTPRADALSAGIVSFDVAGWSP